MSIPDPKSEMGSMTQTFHVLLWQRHKYKCTLKTSPAGGFK